jgi:PST family polysaccharide transporter
MTSLKSNIARGALWLIFGRAIVNILGFVGTLILARMLIPADFGLVALATSLLVIFSAATEMSLSSALINHRQPTEEHFHTAWTLNAGRGLVVGLAFSLASYPVAVTFGEPRIIAVMVVLGLGLALTGLANPKMVIFSKALSFRQEFTISVVEKLAYFLVSVAVALMLKSYWALVAGTLAMQFGRVITSYVIISYRPRFALTHVRDLLSFSIWLTLANTVDTLNGRIDQLILANFLGKTVLGYYTVGDTLCSIPTREATAPLANTLFPAFSQIRDNGPRLREAYTKAQTLISAVAFPVAFGLPLVAEPFVRLGMGEKWLGSVIVIQMVSVVLGLQTISSAVRPLALALGKTREAFHRDLQYFSCRLPIVLAGLWFGGLIGLLIARLISGLLSIYINMRLVRALINIPIRDQLAANLRGIASVLIMVAAVLGLQHALPVAESNSELALILIASVFVGAVAYLAARWVLWFIAGYPSGPEREVLRLAQTAAQQWR